VRRRVTCGSLINLFFSIASHCLPCSNVRILTGAQIACLRPASALVQSADALRLRLHSRQSRPVGLQGRPASRTAEIRAAELLREYGTAEAFYLGSPNYTSTTTRAYQPGVVVNGVTPLVFQDAATVAVEGLNEQPFGAFTTASTANSRERQVQLGVKVEF